MDTLEQEPGLTVQCRRSRTDEILLRIYNVSLKLLVSQLCFCFFVFGIFFLFVFA